MFEIIPTAVEASVGTVVHRSDMREAVQSVSGYQFKHFQDGAKLGRSLILQLPARYIDRNGESRQSGVMDYLWLTKGCVKAIAAAYPYSHEVKEIYIFVTPGDWSEQQQKALIAECKAAFPNLKAVKLEGAIKDDDQHTNRKEN